jgi:flagellar FliJ protein
MKRSKRFEPIRDIASTSATDLSRAMGEAGRRVTDLERQFEQLKTYRDEYVKNSTDDRGTMDAVKLQNYRSFLGRLGDALKQQVTLLDHARAEYENRRLEWSAKRIEAESLGRVIDRFRNEEQRDADRREQREGDDAAMRISIAHAEGGNR